MTSPRAAIVIADDEYQLLFERSAQAALESEVHLTHHEHVPEGVGDAYDLLITSWSTPPFDPALLDGKRLQLAVHAGGSVRAWYPEASLGGRFRLVQAGADAMAPAVAEFSLTLSLAMVRNIPLHDRGMQERLGWEASGHGLLGDALASHNLGIIGLGRTGRLYARMVRALGVTKLRAFDPYADPSWALDEGIELVDLDELLRSSSLVAVHAPSTPETRHLLDGRALSLLADGSIVVNTARSWVIDSFALTAEVSSGRLRAALDVFDEEPLPSHSELLGLPGVLATPHVAGGTRQARAAQGWSVVEVIQAFRSGAPLPYEVTGATYGRLA